MDTLSRHLKPLIPLSIHENPYKSPSHPLPALVFAAPHPHLQIAPPTSPSQEMSTYHTTQSTARRGRRYDIFTFYARQGRVARTEEDGIPLGANVSAWASRDQLVAGRRYDLYVARLGRERRREEREMAREEDVGREGERERRDAEGFYAPVGLRWREFYRGGEGG